MRTGAAIKTICTTALILSFHVLVIIAAHAVDISFGETGTSNASRPALWIVLAATAGAFIAFVALLYIGFASEERDALYWPLLVLFGSISLYLSSSFVRVLDLLLHSDKPRWTYLNQPEIRTWNTILLAVFAGSLLWIGGLFLMGRLEKVSRVLIFYLVMAATFGGFLLVLVILDRYI
jgi:hypothetical protein